jgi:maltose alpha-D-glucosyltransferase/alpha-amylase
MGNTTNLLFRLDLINKKENNESIYSYVLKSYKEYHESLEPSTLYVFVKNNFENAPKIYGTIKLKNMDSLGILEYLPSDGNLGDIFWNELNELMLNVSEKVLYDEIFFEDDTKMYQFIKKECPETLKVSKTIGSSIEKLHKSIILEGDEDYSKKLIESDFYLSNYTHKLNLMIEDLQRLMKEESRNAFYNLPKISSMLIDTKDIIEKFRNEFLKETITTQPVHQDLHMEQILYQKSKEEYKYYFIDFEGDPKLSLEEKKENFPIEKDLAAFLRSLSYIKFNMLLKLIEKFFLSNTEYRVPEEILYNLFFRKATRKANSKLDQILEIINVWEDKFMSKILKSIDCNYTLINFFTIERIIYEINYEILFRPAMAIVPLLGLKELIEKN